MSSSNPQDEVQDLLNRLQAPISDVETLLSHLCAPLDALGLLPPVFRRFNLSPLTHGVLSPTRHVPQLQRVLLQHVAPTWEEALKERKAGALLVQYFCPDAVVNPTRAAGEVAVGAYGVLVSVPRLDAFALRVLERLVVEYPVDRVYRAVVLQKECLDRQGKEREWGDCVSALVKVPGRVANLVGMQGEVPRVLENGVYFERLAERVEVMVGEMAEKGDRESIPYVSYLFGRLVAQGLFPATPPMARTQPSFFKATLPAIQAKLFAPRREAYFAYWNELLANLPSASALQSILISLFGSLRSIDPPLDDANQQRALVREDAILLTELVGKLRPEKEEVWEMVLSVVLKRNWPLSHTRVFVCWVSGAARGGEVDVEALEGFMQGVLELWGDPEYVKHSFLSKHQYVTSMLLIAASYFVIESKPLKELTLNSRFVQGVGRYISHQDPSVRRCGLLVAEEIARMGGKKLVFGNWDGDDSAKPWARSLRKLIQVRDVDANVEVVEPDPAAAVEDEVEMEELVTPAALRTKIEEENEIEEERNEKVHFKNTAEGYDSDDSLAGYDSPPSSRSASPSPEEMAEMEKDPTLNINVKKVARPVYLSQLGDLLRGGSGTKTRADDPHEADKIEMALNTAEELIRKKKDYGTELAENAVNLEYSLLSLNDNYELDDFSAKRQGALNALVACAPRQVAPALIEEFFKNQYSVEQRFVALNALAIGARELASLPVPESRVPANKTSFPSKMLPPAQHARYLTAGKEDTSLVPLLMQDISRKALEQQKPPESVDAPLLAREKVLRIKKPSGISEVSRTSGLQTTAPPKRTTFTEVAAEYFIAPLINRFWLFLREEQMREERTAHLQGMSRYKGTGTGLILNPLVLAHLLRTLGVLVNASQNAPEWLAIVAPEALELAITIGTRPLSYAESRDEEGDGGPEGKEASVLSGALELALVVLDGALEVDGGRTLSLEHTQLLLGANEWATKIFENLEKGLKVEGEGGVHEIRLRRVAAGVLLKVDEVMTRWKRSMVDYM